MQHERQIHSRPKARSVLIEPKAFGNNTAEFGALGGITLVLFGMSLEAARSDLGLCPETGQALGRVRHDIGMFCAAWLWNCAELKPLGFVLFKDAWRSDLALSAT